MGSRIPVMWLVSTVLVCNNGNYGAGADAAVVSEHHAFGGEGAVELAKAIVAACEKPTAFKYLYSVEEPIKSKIEVSSAPP